ncbi:MAG: OsmC family protein [Actinomycetota bacterium]|nr:OsmC family protein [Actinomycetota bacterium]
MNAEATKHAYEAKARSTDTFGRMFWTARHHHMVSDGPVSLGCPGEAIMPGELFLAGIATCAVELIEVFAQEEGLPLEAADAAVWGDIDAAKQPRPDVTLFTSVGLEFELAGVTKDQAEHLVERFKGK